MFNELWFKKNQRVLLNLLNHSQFFRWDMGINKCDLPKGHIIIEIAPNRFTYIDKDYLRFKHDKPIPLTTDFRTHTKFSKRIYYGLKPLWLLAHGFDMMVANRFCPSLNLGFDTLTKYPDPHPETDTVDGIVGILGGGVPWYLLTITETGDFASDTGEGGYEWIAIGAGVTENNWAGLIRAIFLFDTSTLTEGASITSAVLSLYGVFKVDGLSIAPDLNIYSSNPASNTEVAVGDFDSFGSTAFCDTSITYAEWPDSDIIPAGYVDFTLNASGRATIAKTGISKFGLRNANYDVAQNDPSWSSELSSIFYWIPSETEGTSSDPKLVVTYSLAAAAANEVKNII